MNDEFERGFEQGSAGAGDQPAPAVPSAVSAPTRAQVEALIAEWMDEALHNQSRCERLMLRWCAGSLRALFDAEAPAIPPPSAGAVDVAGESPLLAKALRCIEQNHPNVYWRMLLPEAHAVVQIIETNADLHVKVLAQQAALDQQARDLAELRQELVDSEGYRQRCAEEAEADLAVVTMERNTLLADLAAAKAALADEIRGHEDRYEQLEAAKAAQAQAEAAYAVELDALNYERERRGLSPLLSLLETPR